MRGLVRSATGAVGLLLGFLTGGVLAGDVISVWDADVERGYASTHIVVRCQPTVPDPRESATHAFGDLCAHWGVTEIRPAHGTEFKDPGLAAALGLDRTYLLEVPPNTDTKSMAAEFKGLGDEVEHAEIDPMGGVGGFIPNDPNFAQQYAMNNAGQTGGTIDADIDAPEAWAIHTGHPGAVVVAIVDSGVSPHVEFSDRMVPGTNTNNPATPNLTTDGCPHGTHVAGIVAAKGNNGVGVAGMNWEALIMPVRVLNGCVGTELQCANGIIWAANQGADIINMSLQYYTGTQDLQTAVAYAHGLGALLVAAAGNNAGSIVAFPARFPYCMAVAATTHNDLFAGFSNWGNTIDVCAPGDDIFSTWTNNGYHVDEGTSFSAPHVSGLASLMKSYRSSLTNDQIEEILITAVDDLGPAGWDNHFGHGRINAALAMAAVPAPLQMIAAEPPHLAIDARQPYALDGTNPDGWRSIRLTFDGFALDLIPGDFTVTQEGGAGTAPSLVVLSPEAEDMVTAVLSGRIEAGAWTTITHNDSGTSVRLGYLPADVNADGTSGPLDILALVDAANGVSTLPIWSTDINRSGQLESSDILRVIDLLNGAEAYDVFNGMTLP